MKSLGSTLLFFGIGTIVLDLIDYEFMVVAWIHHWGPTVAWGIIGTMIVSGGLLFLLGASESEGPAYD